MGLLCSVSETFTLIGDWIAQHCAELGITISIPVLIGFVAKIIVSLVKNKWTIKNSVLSATKELKQSTNDVKKTVVEFMEQVRNDLTTFKEEIAVQIDNKFVELQEKRQIIYNNAMQGIDHIELVTEKKAEQVLEVLEELEQEAEQIEEPVVEVEQVEEIIEEITEEKVSADSIIR